MSTATPVEEDDRQAMEREQARRLRANDADPDHSSPEDEPPTSDDEGVG